ncbi:pyridoxal phosphate-dependent aminotransferase [Microbulbifer sp. 2304DJ12-6]|uniref:pyridoxal phosphate-dependent aminotransferase n=1 Tax=Microbulbifer sp. 2304DJ12-6 TaxID=3233340 RepID=UPI0039AFD06A
MSAISQRMANVRACPILTIAQDIAGFKKQGKNIVDLSVGVPSFLPGQHVYDAASKALAADSGCYGASKGDEALIRAYLAQLAVDGIDLYGEENIVTGYGAKHLLFSVMFSLFNPGDELLLPAPYWPSYIDIADLTGVKVATLAAPVSADYKITPTQLEQAISPQTKALLFNNPSNPTGAVYSKSEVAALAEVLAIHQIWLITDDVYNRFVFEQTELSHLLHFEPQLAERLVKIDSLSKSYGMPGWRIGMLAAPVELTNAVIALNSNSVSNIPQVVNQAATAALEGPQTIHQTMCKVYQDKRDIVLNALAGYREIRCPKPQGAFYVFPDISGCYGRVFDGAVIADDVTFAGQLLSSEGVAVLPGRLFGEPNSIRISYTVEIETLVEGLSRLGRFISQLQDPLTTAWMLPK